MRVLVSGTNTGVGKTIFTAMLCKSLMDAGRRVKYIKAVQTGYPEDDDAGYVRQYTGLSEEDCKVLFTAERPVAPCLEFEEFPFKKCVHMINSSDDCDDLIVEGAGGIAVPLDYTRYIYDIADKCALEALVVVPNRLGCINECLLNYEFLKSKKISFRGFAFNDYFQASENDALNTAMLEKLLPGYIRYRFHKELQSF